MSAWSGRPTPGVNVRFALWTLLYLGGIYALSSIPEPPARDAHAWLMLVSNLAHAPVFAGLAVLVLKALSGTHGAHYRYVTAFLVTAACGALDEWHQSHVPGRVCSIADFLADACGAAAAVAFLRARLYEDRASALALPFCILALVASVVLGTAWPW